MSLCPTVRQPAQNIALRRILTVSENVVTACFPCELLLLQKRPSVLAASPPRPLEVAVGVSFGLQGSDCTNLPGSNLQLVKMAYHNPADSMDGDIPPEPEGLSPTAPPRSPVSYAPGCYKKPIDAVLAQTKRHLHDVVNDFERKRTAYFVEAFHSHRVYWQVSYALHLTSTVAT
jgi:hypothetical protein